MRANTLYHRDVEYVVKNGEVIIVDEHTGRLMDGRRWSDGLHQAVEAGIAGFWERYTGLDGDVIGMTGFGESAPADQLFKLFGFTEENIIHKVKNLIEQ